MPSAASHAVQVRGVGDEGQILHGWIAAEDFRVALEDVAASASQGYQFDEMRESSDNLQVMWQDSVGHQAEPGHISFTDVVSQQGIRADDFMFRILEVDHGHNDEQRTRWIAEDKFDLSGSFVVSGPDGSVNDGNGKEVVVVPIEPYW